MRVAIVKQLLDTLGPWSTLRWAEASPRTLSDLWPGRGLHWETTTLLQADWYVVPQQCNTDYIYDSVLRAEGRADAVRKYTQRVVQVSQIPWEKYDVVIATDPVFDFPRRQETLFTYFVAEHWDRRYQKSMRKPLRNADLFLAHMMDAPAQLHRLPQAVAFPYVRDPKTMRELFASDEREEGVWADWRMLATLGAAHNGNTAAATESAARRLEATLGIKVAFRQYAKGLYHGEDPPRWGDIAGYNRELGKQKYYLCLGRGSGAGQGLADAASLGCLCFGEQDKAYHRLLCHSETLCGDLQELPRRVKRVRASEDLQKEIYAWQEVNLQKHFVDGPLQLLREALDRKRGGEKHAAAAKISHLHAAPVKEPETRSPRRAGLR